MVSAGILRVVRRSEGTDIVWELIIHDIRVLQINGA